MTVKKVVSLFVIGVITVTIWYAKLPKTLDLVNEKEAGSIDSTKFLDNELFAKGESKRVDLNINKHVSGIIVPHHTLASYLLSSAFSQLRDVYEIVILLGPNHKQVGMGTLAYTADSAFATPLGKVNVDKVLIGNITQNSDIEIDNGVVSDEHSINVPMTYIAKYLPHAKVAPIVLSETNNIDGIRKLVNVLTPLINDGVLVIASVDFSHHLSVTEAKNRDLDTINAIQSSDYLKINSFTEGNLDSSTSVILLDMLMKEKGNGRFRMLANTNSFELTGYNKDVTSYIVGVYGK